MLSARSILVAAAAAFAMAHVAAAGSPHVKVSLYHTKGHPICSAGESEMSVEGVEGVFCVTGQACVADFKNGACPGKSKDLPFGSHCGEVHKGVYGCIPNDDGDDDDDDNSDECGDDETSVSVQGADRDFCVKGQVCVADIKGACPGKDKKYLPEGSYCGKVQKGVLGCIKGKAPGLRKHTKSYTKQHTKCEVGFTEVSVEGVEGSHCAKDQVCVADIANGNCPGKSKELPFGSYCAEVRKGVYGCKPKTEDDDDDDDDDDDSTEECGKDETPVSVEGTDLVFCVKGQVCVADIKDGACPGKSEDLPEGSYCGEVQKGVYGCIKGKAPKKSHIKN